MFQSGKWCILWSTLFGGICLAHGGQPSEIDSAWVTKAKAAIKPLVEKYEPMATRLDEIREVDYKQKGARPMPKSLIVHLPPIRERVVRLGDNVFSEQTFRTKGNEDQITTQCQNNDYSFRLVKVKKSGEYSLDDYKPGKQDNPLINRLTSVHGGLFTHLAGILMILEKSPKNLTSVHFDQATGMLRISYKFPEHDQDAQFQLDPAKDWRLVDRRMETKSAIFTDQWSYGITVSGVSFPIEDRATATYKVSPAPPDFERIDRVISIKLTDKTDADFRMSAFGLKEPMGMPPVNRGSLMWLWISVAAAVSLSIAVAFWKLRRRYEIPQAAKT